MCSGGECGRDGKVGRVRPSKGATGVQANQARNRQKPLNNKIAPQK